MTDSKGKAQGESPRWDLRSWRPPDLLLDAIAQNEGASRSVTEIVSAIGLCAEQWKLEILPPFHNVTQNFVAPVNSATHGPAVLKVAFNAFMFERECLALRSFDGGGAVRVLEWDSSASGMLLERAEPGLPMALDWDAETEAFCGLLKALWKPADAETVLPTVAFECEARLRDLVRMQAMLEGTGCDDRCATIENAIRTLTELASSSDERFLVHGDLHTDNMLSSGRLPWLSIDPIGCVGERAFDACSLLRDETSALRTSSNPRELIERRLRTLARECGLDEGRLRAWSFVEAVRIQGWLYGVGMPTSEWSLLIPALEG